MQSISSQSINIQSTCNIIIANDVCPLFSYFTFLQDYLQPLLLLWLWTVYWSSATAIYPDFWDGASIVTYILLLIALFLHILVFSYMLHFTLRFTQNISFITVLPLKLYIATHPFQYSNTNVLLLSANVLKDYCTKYPSIFLLFKVLFLYSLLFTFVQYIVIYCESFWNLLF